MDLLANGCCRFRVVFESNTHSAVIERALRAPSYNLNAWMCVAVEDDSETLRPICEQVRSCIMATSGVVLKWISFIIIIAKDDNDNNNKDIESWNGSGNVWMNGWFCVWMDKYCNGCICDWGLVWDDIDIGDGTRDIMGGTAAPGSVVIQIIFVYWEGGVGVVLCLYLYWDIYWEYICLYG